MFILWLYATGISISAMKGTFWLLQSTSPSGHPLQVSNGWLHAPVTGGCPPGHPLLGGGKEAGMGITGREGEEQGGNRRREKGRLGP